MFVIFLWLRFIEIKVSNKKFFISKTQKRGKRCCPMNSYFSWRRNAECRWPNPYAVEMFLLVHIRNILEKLGCLEEKAKNDFACLLGLWCSLVFSNILKLETVAGIALRRRRGIHDLIRCSFLVQAMKYYIKKCMPNGEHL